jgi:hypothetical protein
VGAVGGRLGTGVGGRLGTGIGLPLTYLKGPVEEPTIDQTFNLSSVLYFSP